MNNRYSGIDVMTCVQGNTARSAEFSRAYGAYGDRSFENTVSDHRSSNNRKHSDVERSRCVVYDFRREDAVPGRTAANSAAGNRKASSHRTHTGRSLSRRRAARARARRVLVLRTVLFAFLVIFTIFGIGGIASRAKSREVPAAYKYYDTITVGYQENLLDIVERYDDRDHYETQIDYVEELCRINNLDFDGTAYPVVTPGTHLVVPYYSTELK